MVDFKKLGGKAKDLVDKRGGTDALKDDAAELKDIATGKGSLAEKAKAAAAALKDPGEAGAEDEAAGEPKPEASAEAEPMGAGDERAERQARRAERRKERAERREGGGDAA